MSLESKKEKLEHEGFFVGDRDWNRNTAFVGKYMVAENHGMGLITEDAGTGGFCVVGDNLEALIDTAMGYFFS